MRLSTLTIMLSSLTCVCLPVKAEHTPSVALTAGTFDFENDAVAMYGVEYRWPASERFFSIIPVAGIESNADGAFWVYAGGRYDFWPSERWFLTPHWAASWYRQNGGKDLGSELEFRSGLDFGYRFEGGSRFAVGVHHLSNADFGDTNPSSNNIVFSFSIPLD